jgi:uncharacterized protein (DUF58 family)
MPRGVWTVGPVRHEKSDALGLARRGLGETGAVQLWVRPRVAPLELMSSGSAADLEGTPSEQISMSDLAFHALREYQPGDDLRHVHWRSSAKADQLLVRQYHETRHGHVTVLLDHEAASYARDDDFELAVSVACSVALRAVTDGLDVYLQCGEEAHTTRQPEQVLDLGCRFRRDGGVGYLQRARAATTATRGTGLVVQVSGTRRPVAELRGAVSRFDQEAVRLVLRADTAGQVQVTEFRRSREVTLSGLEQLPGLVARSLR